MNSRFHLFCFLLLVQPFLVTCFTFPNGTTTRVGNVFDESDSEESMSIMPSYINPVPANVVPTFAFDEEGGCIAVANPARRFKETKGIVVNTVLELESHAVHSLFDGTESDQSQSQPPVYTVGPLIHVKGEHQVLSDPTQIDKIMKWLDDQPPKSVVFLCFGSLGSFDETQLNELTIGLEQGGQRFLWSVLRKPPKGEYITPGDYTNHEGFLPHGFLERIQGLGMLCGWAPQVEILGHKVIGEFVSHCGYNFILESVWYGVSILTWSLYAEQKLNAFQIVRDLGLGVELRMDYKNTGGDFVTADEIEKAVRLVMVGDGESRKRFQEMSELCRKVVDDGGSSSASFGSLIEIILSLKSN